MKPKIWGDDNPAAQAVGEAKIRQLAQVNSPFLTASGPGFKASITPFLREIELSAPSGKETFVPRVVTHDFSGADTETSRFSQGLSGWKVAGKTIDGLYVGQFCGMAIAQPYSATSDEMVSCPTTVNPYANYQNQTRVIYQPSGKIRFEITSWSDALKVYSSRVIVSGLTSVALGLSGLSACLIGGEAPTVRMSCLGIKKNGAAVHCIGAFGFRSTEKLDDYGFSTVIPAVFRLDTGNNLYGDELTPPSGTNGNYSSHPATPVTIRPGEAFMLVSQFFHPQRDVPKSADGSDAPQPRVISYRTTDWGASWTPNVTAIVEDYLADIPDMDNQGNNPQPVAWNASKFNCPLNLQLLRLTMGCGLTVAQDTALWFCSEGNGLQVDHALDDLPWVDQDQEARSQYGVSVFRTTNGGLSFTRTFMREPDSSYPYWVDAINLPGGKVLARVRYGMFNEDGEVFLYLSEDGGQSWGQLAPAGLPAMSNQSVGIPRVHEVSGGRARIVMPVREVAEAGEASVIYVSDDNGSSWVRRGKMAVLTDAATFVAPMERCTAYPESISDTGFYYDPAWVIGYGQAVTVRDRKNNPYPADPVLPWVLEEDYEEPSA